MYDVIVVGAGPSGTFAAIKLASAGLHVLVIDKQKFPRQKLCGGGISPKATKLVSKYLDLSKSGANKIDGIFMANSNKNLLYIKQAIPAYSIERSHFDNLLLNKAVEFGSETLLPGLVKKITEEKECVKVLLENKKIVKAKFLILAEGINGKLHKQLGYSGKKNITMAIEADLYPEQYPSKLASSLLFDTGSINNGYAWMFPKKESINCGVYFYNSNSVSKEQKETLSSFINNFEWSKNSNLGKVKGYPIPRDVKYNFYNTSRTLLTGDACGAAENFFGEGIYLGMLSGDFAAKSIIANIKKDEPLSNYSKIIRKRISKKVKYSRILANFFYKNQNFCYKYLVMNGKMNKIYHQYVQGKINSRSVLYLTFLLLPFSNISKILEEEEFSTLGLVKNK